MKTQKYLFAACLLMIGATVGNAGVLPAAGLPALLVVDVPEPGSAVLLGSALLAVIGLARRQSKR